MAAATEYTVLRACEGCQRALPADAAPQRLFCDACRGRRRMVTFLRQAHDIAIDIGDDAAAGAIDQLVHQAGAPR